MNLVIALLIGMLFAASLYLLLQRSLFKIIFGIIIFGYGTIFFLFVMGGVTRSNPALFLDGEAKQAMEMADPLPQALTLTAIVISIGLQLFTLILLKRTYEASQTTDLDDFQNTDQID